MKIILLGEPKSTSTIYHYHCRSGFPKGYMSAKGKSLKEDYQWQVKSQYHGKPTVERIKLTIEVYFGTKRIQDLDNFNKLILDACTGLVWEDDSQIDDLRIIRKYDKKNPRMELEL